MKVRKVMSSTGMEGGYWAQRDGYYVGMNGDPKSRNPSPSGTPNYDRWNDSWDRGHEVHLRMKTRSEQDGRLTEQVFGDLGRIATLEQQLETAEKEATRLSNYEAAYNNLRLLTRSQYDDIDLLTDERDAAWEEFDRINKLGAKMCTERDDYKARAERQNKALDAITTEASAFNSHWMDIRIKQAFQLIEKLAKGCADD